VACCALRVTAPAGAQRSPSTSPSGRRRPFMA